jgi:hypothetical protein
MASLEILLGSMCQALIAFALLGTSSAAAGNSDPLYKIGQRACNTVLFGQEPKFAEKYYLRFADLVDIDRAQLCRCVAQQFVDNVSTQREVLERIGAAGEADAMLEITKSNLDSCLPNFDDLDYATQGMIMRGAPEGSHELAEGLDNPSDDFSAAKPLDQKLCQMIARGRIELEATERDYLARWTKKSGLQVDEMCSVCVVEMMQDRRNLLAQDGEILSTDRGVSHRSYVVSSLMECMQNNFKLPMQ